MNIEDGIELARGLFDSHDEFDGMEFAAEVRVIPAPYSGEDLRIGISAKRADGRTVACACAISETELEMSRHPPSMVLMHMHMRRAAGAVRGAIE